MPFVLSVIPVKTGIQFLFPAWTPAFAGVTGFVCYTLNDRLIKSKQTYLKFSVEYRLAESDKR